MDKTGTLTENRMTVARLLVGTDSFTVEEAATDALPEGFHPLVEFSILASAIDPFDPMEQAFQRLGQRFLAKTEHLHRDWTLVQEYGLTPVLLGYPAMLFPMHIAFLDDLRRRLGGRRLGAGA